MPILSFLIISPFQQKMSAFCKVIIPVDDSVEAKDVVYRIGEESEDPMRGPSLELGYREKGEDGKMQENLIIDGQILNTIRRFTVKFGFSGVAMFLGDLVASLAGDVSLILLIREYRL